MLNMHPEAREELVPYLDSVKGIAERFPHTPMCIDCNEIEGKIKRAVSADKFFSFSASEIRRGYLRSPNNRHKFLDENIKFYSNLYQAIEERLVKKRKKFIEDLIDQAVEHGVYWGRTITLQNFFDEDTLLREFPPYTSSTEQKKAINRGEAVRHMASWTKNEETELFEMNRNGISVEEISKKLGRSEKAVGIRLQKISQINNEP